MPMRMSVSSAAIVQVAATFIAVLLLTLLVWQWQIKSPLNWLWMLVAPIVIALVFNDGIRRTRMLVALPIASFLTIGAAAAAMGYP